MSDEGPTRVGELLDTFLERKGVGRQVRRMDVLEAWSERVGEAIAEVAEAKSLSEGTLFVEVRSSAWLMELNMMKGRILDRLNEGRPDDARVERIVFVLGAEG